MDTVLRPRWCMGEVLADERDDEGRGRDDLGEQQEEHSQRQQDRDTQRDLLTCSTAASRIGELLWVFNQK